MESKELTPQPAVIVVPVCLPPRMVKALDAQAAREGLLRGRSALIRRACATLLRQAEEHGEGAGADVLQEVGQ